MIQHVKKFYVWGSMRHKILSIIVQRVATIIDKKGKEVFLTTTM